MKKSKTVLAGLLVLVMITGLFGMNRTVEAKAAAKPDKPEFNVSLTDNYGEALITIGKTNDAEGYRIYIKAPGEKKYKKLVNIAKDGTKKRSYTAAKLVTGTYSFRVRAYSKASGRTVWSSYSAVRKLEMIDAETRAHIDRMNEIAADEYPDLYTMVEDGKLGLTMDDASNVYFTLGSYDMPDRNGNRQKKDIEWIVLDYDEDEGKALLLSRYVLDTHVYNDEFADVTWETCTLRTWLNETFLYNAFSEKERNKLILRSNVKNSLNNDFGVNGGNDTKDRVFLLSYAEACELLIGYEKALYGGKATLFDGSTKDYWLRGPGNLLTTACFVNTVGIPTYGKLLIPTGKIYSSNGATELTGDIYILGTVNGAGTWWTTCGSNNYVAIGFLSTKYTNLSFGGIQHNVYETHPDGVRPAIWIKMN